MMRNKNMKYVGLTQTELKRRLADLKITEEVFFDEKCQLEDRLYEMECCLTQTARDINEIEGLLKPPRKITVKRY